MTQSKHTPGAIQIVNDQGTIYLRDKGGYEIAQVYRAVDHRPNGHASYEDVQNANAHLWAAAPELFEACQLVENCKTTEAGEIVLGYYEYTQIMAALRKAKGEI